MQIKIELISHGLQSEPLCRQEQKDEQVRRPAKVNREETKWSLIPEMTTYFTLNI